MNESKLQNGMPIDLRYATKHDSIHATLATVDNWYIKADLSLSDQHQAEESLRLKKFHLLIRDISKRFCGHRDLNRVGWFLRQEGNGKDRDKRFHFHCLLTSDNLERTSAEVVCHYIQKQWKKIAKSTCDIEPWDPLQGTRGILYVTELETYKLPHSTYFGGDVSHWRMSSLLHTKIRHLNQER